jgi:triosephosphate isomerase (TIM)
MAKPAALVIGNWKMNGDIGMAESLLAELATAFPLSPSHGLAVAVCPPFPYLGLAAARLSGSGVTWGAQTLASVAKGAFTGEVSGAMLADLKCRYVIIGHSERRQFFGETNEAVAAKVTQALAGGLTPVICVGESLADRESDRFASFISMQLGSALSVLKPGDSFVIAYEPIWAIGTGKTASAQQAQEVHQLIRAQLGRSGFAAQSIPILYGGSVKADNAAQLFAQPDINGCLIGGASLVAADFIHICKAAQAKSAK